MRCGFLDLAEDKSPGVAAKQDPQRQGRLAGSFAAGVRRWAETSRLRFQGRRLLVVERPNREIKRRTRVVSILPNRESLVRLAGALLLEELEDWLIGRRYISDVSMNRLHAPPVALAQANTERLLEAAKEPPRPMDSDGLRTMWTTALRAAATPLAHNAHNPWTTRACRRSFAPVGLGLPTLPIGPIDDDMNSNPRPILNTGSTGGSYTHLTDTTPS